MSTQHDTSTDSQPARPLDPLVGPFERDQTKEWRRRADILEALGNMIHLAREARDSLNWRAARTAENADADLKMAAVALAELRMATELLWPNDEASNGPENRGKH